MRSAAAAAAMLSGCLGDLGGAGIARSPDSSREDAGADLGAAAAMDGAPEIVGDRAPVSYPLPCPDIYADDLLPTFEVTMASTNLAKLRDLYNNHDKLKQGGTDLKQYVDLALFRYGKETYSGAQIRLKGNDEYSWAPAQTKMQFVIKFPKTQLFHGVRRLALDSPWYDASLLRERLATHFARDVGQVAACVNNARLNINGAYYALYANLEQKDREFLRRNFPDPSGNLWKNGGFAVWGGEIEEGDDNGDQQVLNDTLDVPTLEVIGDLDQWIHEWAAEAVMPNGDGYWCAGHNWLTYHDPIRGWQWLLNDSDAAFGWGIYGPDADPVSCANFSNRVGLPAHFKAVLGDAKYASRYRAALKDAFAKYDVAVMQRRLDTWNAQIRAAAEADPNKTWTPSPDASARRGSHDPGPRDPDLVRLGKLLVDRRSYLRMWLGL